MGFLIFLDSVVSVENGIFSWDSDMQPALRE